jgi:hypothetical protein
VSTRSAAELYEDDFYAWTQLQAKELRRFARTRPNLPLDRPHIAEEIADLGNTLRASLRSWARHIIEHLLLLEYSPAQEPRRGWTAEIVNLRSEIEDRLTPILHRDLRQHLPFLYERAQRPREEACAVRRTPHCRSLPERCPYTVDQVLDDFWPDWRRNREPLS